MRNSLSDVQEKNIYHIFHLQGVQHNMFVRVTTLEGWKKLKTLNVILSFIVCTNRNRSALVANLLSYNSLFVGQLYGDKS